MGIRFQLSKDQIECLMRIPVYPDSIRPCEFGKVHVSIPVDALICEDKGRLSFVSKKAKDDFFKKVTDRRAV